MAEFHKILKADPLGEPWTPNMPNAKPLQNWWCQVEGQDKAVSISRQADNPLKPGQHVYGDLMYAKSQKGTEYWKFKSQKVPEGVTRPADSPAQEQAQQATQPQEVGGQVPGWAVPLYNMTEYIYKEMKRMNGEEEPQPAPQPQPEAKEAKVEQVGGDPIDPETQATLDNIFGGTEVPEGK